MKCLGCSPSNGTSSQEDPHVRGAPFVAHLIATRRYVSQFHPDSGCRLEGERTVSSSPTQHDGFHWCPYRWKTMSHDVGNNEIHLFADTTEELLLSVRMDQLVIADSALHRLLAARLSSSPVQSNKFHDFSRTSEPSYSPCCAVRSRARNTLRGIPAFVFSPGGRRSSLKSNGLSIF